MMHAYEEKRLNCKGTLPHSTFHCKRFDASYFKFDFINVPALINYFVCHFAHVKNSNACQQASFLSETNWKIRNYGKKKMCLYKYSLLHFKCTKMSMLR